MAIAGGDYTGSTGGKVEDNSLGRLITLSDGCVRDRDDPARPGPAGSRAARPGDQHGAAGRAGRELPGILTFLLSLYVVASYWFPHHRLSRWSSPPIPGCCAAHPALWLVVAVMPVLDEPLRALRVGPDRARSVPAW